MSEYKASFILKFKTVKDIFHAIIREVHKSHDYMQGSGHESSEESEFFFFFFFLFLINEESEF